MELECEGGIIKSSAIKKGYPQESLSKSCYGFGFSQVAAIIWHKCRLTIRSRRLATAVICNHTLPAKALVSVSYLAGPQAA
jgi:hypothetical protein